MFIEILNDLPASVGGHKKSAVLKVTEAEGKFYISAGSAKARPDLEDEVKKDATEELAGQFAAMKAQVRQEVLAEVASAGKKGLGPAYRIDPVPGENPEDRQKCFGTQVKYITMAQCPHAYPGMQQEANEKLDKVYGSTLRTFTKANTELNEGSGPTGAYTVKPEYAAELLKLSGEKSIVRPYANVKKLPAREAYYPMLDQTFVPAGTQAAPQTAFAGGVQMTWLGEAQTGTKTAPDFKQVHLKTNELQGLCPISRFLLADSFLAIDSELKGLFSYAFAWAEDYAFLYGDGNAKPKGIVNSAATFTYGTRATANKFSLADAANMAGAMLPESRTQMVWIATNNAFPQIIQLVDASGRVTYVNNVGSGYGEAKLMAGQTGLLMLGRPVIFSEKLPALGTAGDILGADLSKYLVGDTGELEIAASDQYLFANNQIMYRIIGRVDGRPQIDSVVTQQDGSTKIAPFVILHA